MQSKICVEPFSAKLLNQRNRELLTEVADKLRAAWRKVEGTAVDQWVNDQVFMQEALAYAGCSVQLTNLLLSVTKNADQEGRSVDESVGDRYLFPAKKSS